MSGFVLDSSVALRWFLDQPIPIYANRVKQFFLKGARAVVPALWHLEMSNALAVAERRSILSAADVDKAMIDIEQIAAQAVDTDSTVVSIRQSLTQHVPFNYPLMTRFIWILQGESGCRSQPLTKDSALRQRTLKLNCSANLRVSRCAYQKLGPILRSLLLNITMRYRPCLRGYPSTGDLLSTSAAARCA